jgi:general secretion pathway protein D
VLNREGRLLAVVAIGWLALSCGPGSTAYNLARKAELRKDWDTALVNYDKALASEPENAKFIIHERISRTNASLFHLKQGQTLFAAGRVDDAAGEFQKAASIDPSNMAAASELNKVLAIQAEAKKQRETKLKEALKSREEEAIPANVQLKPLSQEPVGRFKLSSDSRKVFETIAKMADLNVAFQSEFHPVPVAVDLANVKIGDVLSIVCLQTKSFYKVVTPNTILIIPDTPGNRRTYEDEVVKTVYLSNPLQATDRAAITTALKQILQMQKIVDNPDTNAIILRDTPERVAEAERLIHDLDRGKAEILIDVQVVEADRDRTRDLGLTPVQVSPSGSITPGIQGGIEYNPGAASSGTAFTWNNLVHQYYTAILPSAEANAILNDSRSHILQSPEVRTTDGQKASLKIGSRVPYAVGSFLPSFGGVTGGTGAGGTGGAGIGLLASTQFQFQDVGVNLELTPRLEPDGEIAIHASVEISSVGPSQSFGGGLSEPTFNQRKVEHDIRLKEGEVNVLGGLLQSTVTHTVAGTPFLGDVPLLRYLFSTEHTGRSDVEVLIMLTPHVVRLPEAPIESTGRTVSGTQTPEPVPEAGSERPGGPPL